MRKAPEFSDYELIDASEGERLERWKDIILIRPDPQVIWNTPKDNPMWRKPAAKYVRSKSGGGSWEIYKKLPPSWKINYKDMRFNIKTMGFKHTGLFPEQAANWEYVRESIKKVGRPARALNLFAYTGAATLACLAENAEVTHVDASRGMTDWAKENARLSGLSDRKVRWIVDDCVKFVKREIRRGNKYDIIIMDPPSYGRGPNGEIWKLENEIYGLVSLCSQILSESPILFMINSYTAGLSPSVMNYILQSVMKEKFKLYFSDEIGITVTSNNLILPCGSTAIASADI